MSTGRFLPNTKHLLRRRSNQKTPHKSWIFINKATLELDMNYRSRLTVPFALIFLLFSGMAQAQHFFLEDFTTTEFKENISNGANWDTEAGELRMWPFVASLEGVADTPGSAARNISLFGQLAYVANGYAGISIVNINDPYNPVTVGNLDTPGYVYEVQVEGMYGYAADHSGDLQVISVLDPLAPGLVASLSLPEVALALCVNGNFVYVASGGSGLAIVDISNPLLPQLVGTVPATTARSVFVDGEIAYVGNGDDGLLIVDVSDPVNPSAIASYGVSGYVRDVEVRGNYAFVAVDEYGLEIVDITDPADPVPAGTVSESGSMFGLSVHGQRAYLANDTAGLKVIDISDPFAPYLLETIDTPGHANAVAVAGEMAFVADFGPGVQAIKVAEFTNSFLRNRGDHSVSRGLPAVSGDLVYFPAGNLGMKVVDMSNPGIQVLVANYQTDGYVRCVRVAGNRAYLTRGSEGIEIVDISDPANPVSLGSVETPVQVYVMEIAGNFAYAVDTVNQLYTIDISDPENPQITDQELNPGIIQRMEIVGDYMFTHGYGSTLQVYDISNPAFPVAYNSFDLPSGINGTYVSGSKMYLATDGSPLIVVDISDPGYLRIVEESISDEQGHDVVVLGENVYVSTDSNIYLYSIRSGLHFRGSFAASRFVDMVPFEYGFLTNTIYSSEVSLYQTIQDEVDQDRPWGFSTSFAAAADDMYRVRYTSNHLGSFAMDVYVEGGLAIYSGEKNTWYRADYPGTTLTWGARLNFVPGIVSTISELKIEWLNHHPLIENISDIPNDQGRQVSLEWIRSGHDFIGDEEQIMEYAVYRQIDGDLLNKADLHNKADQLSKASSGSPALQENAAAMLVEGWHFLTTVPAMVEDNYAVVVPTLADSTLSGGDYESIFKVVALTGTPGMNFSSYPDSGTSLDNLAPGAPSAVMAVYGAGNVELSWDESPANDFQYFRIYRGTDPNFIPNSGNNIHQVITPFWNDEVDSPFQYYYKITAMDFSGNESLAGEVQNTSGVQTPGSTFALYGASPNPFNPSTLIKFSLPQTGRVQLLVYDVAGRLVRTLVDDVLPGGEQQVRWDGRNQSGKLMASGVYFSLLRNGQQTQRQRMMLMK